jgi:ribosomal 50S subunit-recycling heat shock protein
MYADADFEIEINGEKIRDSVYVNLDDGLSITQIQQLQQARAQQIYDETHELVPIKGD